MSKTIPISGASSGIGNLAAHRLADAGHLVYAGMCAVADRNKAAAEDAADYSSEHGVTLATHRARRGVQDVRPTMREIEAPDADVTDVATAIAAAKGTRPYRVHIDPSMTAPPWSSRWATVSGRSSSTASGSTTSSTPRCEPAAGSDTRRSGQWCVS